MRASMIRLVLAFFLVLAITSSGGLAWAQNTFPPSGNAGIGTLTPVVPLDVRADSYLPILIVTSSTLGGGIGMETTAAGGHRYSIFSSGPGALTGAGTFAIYDETVGAYRMLLDSVGRFGFGTMFPVALMTLTTPNASGIVQIGQLVDGFSWGAIGFQSTLSSSNYALAATPDGPTLLNALAGQPIIFNVNNVEQVRVSVSGLSSGKPLISTVTTGTAPFTVSSTTNIPNLNASSLNGATFASPGSIGSGTPGTGAFTTLTATGLIQSSSTLPTPISQSIWDSALASRWGATFSADVIQSVVGLQFEATANSATNQQVGLWIRSRATGVNSIGVIGLQIAQEVNTAAGGALTQIYNIDSRTIVLAGMDGVAIGVESEVSNRGSIDQPYVYGKNGAGSVNHKIAYTAVTSGATPATAAWVLGPGTGFHHGLWIDAQGLLGGANDSAIQVNAGGSNQPQPALFRVDKTGNVFTSGTMQADSLKGPSNRCVYTDSNGIFHLAASDCLAGATNITGSGSDKHIPFFTSAQVVAVNDAFIWNNMDTQLQLVSDATQLAFGTTRKGTFTMEALSAARTWTMPNRSGIVATYATGSANGILDVPGITTNGPPGINIAATLSGVSTTYQDTVLDVNGTTIGLRAPGIFQKMTVSADGFSGVPNPCGNPVVPPCFELIATLPVLVETTFTGSGPSGGSHGFNTIVTVSGHSGHSEYAGLTANMLLNPGANTCPGGDPVCINGWALQVFATRPSTAQNPSALWGAEIFVSNLQAGNTYGAGLTISNDYQTAGLVKLDDGLIIAPQGTDVGAGRLETWTNAFRVGDSYAGATNYRFKVVNDGSTYINVPAGFSGYSLTVQQNSSTPVFRVRYDGNIVFSEPGGGHQITGMGGGLGTVGIAGGDTVVTTIAVEGDHVRAHKGSSCLELNFTTGTWDACGP